MRTITLEEHFVASGFAEASQRGSAHQNADDELRARLLDLGPARLQSMDAGGVDVQVISHAPPMVASLSPKEDVRLTQQANDQLAAAVEQHPTRFAGFALLPMTDPAAATAELRRAVETLGFKGAMVHGTANGQFLDAPDFAPLLEQAAALDVPIYLHPAPPPQPVVDAYYAGFDPAVSASLAMGGWGWHSETAIHALRLILAGVFDRLPTLQILLGHMGEMIPFMLARIDARLTPVAHLPRPIPDYFLSNFHITTSGFFTDPPLLLALQTFGADRILYSVDYPYSTNEEGRAFLDSAPISPADKAKISSLNAERLLKLPSA